jgi:hypothetical protein
VAPRYQPYLESRLCWIQRREPVAVVIGVQENHEKVAVVGLGPYHDQGWERMDWSETGLLAYCS